VDRNGRRVGMKYTREKKKVRRKEMIGMVE
jgi:hypothetical protein